MSLLAFAMIALGASNPGTAIDSHLDRDTPALLDLYRHLHQNPELSYFEEQTAARMAQELRSAGYQVTEKLGKYADPSRTGHGVVAVLANGDGPTLLLRADMDALPVEEKTGLPYASRARTKDDSGADVATMHACSHDMHMSVLVGAARVMSAMKNEWSGTLILVAQPAEERSPGGADALLRDGLYTRFKKPDWCLALHGDAQSPAGKVGVVPGYALANVDTVDITVRGVGGHGSSPHLAKDPIVIAAEIVLALQTIVSREVKPGEPAVVTVGSIHGGTKHNIIPDEVVLQLTVRSYAAETRAKILASIERIAMNTARAAGVPPGREPNIDLNPELLVPATYNDPALAERCAMAMRTVLGEENVENATPVTGGEDFGAYSLPDRSVPCFMFWLGAVDPQTHAEARKSGALLPSLHSSLYAPLAEPMLRTGVKAMTACALDLLARKR
jgi:hippurate hydrolase